MVLRDRYLPVRSRCLHPGQQQGRRWPSSSSSWVRRMRRSRVVACLASSTQQMNSLRAKGVMSFQASSAVALAISALRRSAGSLCTTPPGILGPLTGPMVVSRGPSRFTTRLWDAQKLLSELAKLGARLIIQRAVEEEFDSWLGRARYERRPDAVPGKRNGFRPRHLQTGEGELRIEIPQVREAAEPFVSKLFPMWHSRRRLRTDPLNAMIVGAFGRGLSIRDVESLCEEAGLGKTSKSTVARICSELHERFVAFQKRDLDEIKLVALFLDAIYLPVRPHGPKEGVMCAWGSPRTASARWCPCDWGCGKPRRTGSSSDAT
jgi:Transposase, Mutator family